YINKALSGLLDTIYIVYLNNIIVYFNNYEVYTYYKYKLYINLKKYTFYTTSINFLGFIISVNGVLIEKSQVDTIKEWPYPTTFREV
ncbi:uncharacterized protein K441DRAFT_585102, partial [Cenococcum geophilum 1.58]|uniref:uncharacterized protein n=1 Tax=Cenococcum geophilum 1.58 TaxID=794803 RepID=UPI00358FC447